MVFDPFIFVRNFENRSPKLTRFAAMKILGVISPFNRHLSADLLEWTDQKAVISLKRRRGVRNHVKSVHAGALFTLGETCAGLVIIRNFPFQGFRPLMSEVNVRYLKQARGDVIGTCNVAPEAIAKMHADLKAGEIPAIVLTTEIHDGTGRLIAVATTNWQVKPWQMVKTKI